MVDGRPPIFLRAARVYREKGAPGLWFAVLSHLGYRHLVLIERRLDEPVVPVEPRVQTEIRCLNNGDTAAYQRLVQAGATAFARRLETGHQCWGAWCSGELRHVAWVAFRRARVEHLRCQVLLDEDVAYVYRVFTHETYRRFGLGPATRTAYIRTLREQGFRLLLAGVVPENPWGLDPFLRAGYRRVGVASALGTGSRPRVLVRLDRGVEAGRGWRFERSSGEDLP